MLKRLELILQEKTIDRSREMLTASDFEEYTYPGELLRITQIIDESCFRDSEFKQHILLGFVKQAEAKLMEQFKKKPTLADAIKMVKDAGLKVIEEK
jgi:hypothetical protein